MSSFADYLENKLLDHVFGGTAYSAPGTLYAALFTAAPTDAGGGTEVTGGSYARAAITNNTTNFPNASGGAKSNGTAITFATATADWGTVTAIGIMDASTSGNLLGWATITSQSVPSGVTASIPVGDLDITLT
jgi:hypothetical protein